MEILKIVCEHKRMPIVIALCLLTSSCVSTPKTLEPTPLPERQPPAVPEQVTQEPVPIPVEPQEIETPQPTFPMEISAEKVAPLPPPEIKLTYAQVTNLIGEFLAIKTTETDTGETKYVGTSENNLVTLEMEGEKDNIKLVSMKLVYPKDIEKVNVDLNNAMMLRLLRNIVPEYDNSSKAVEDIINRYYSMQIGSKAQDNININGREIQILYDRGMDSITLTFRP